MNSMIPAQLFARAGQALFGTGQDWKAQFGAALMIKPDTIDAMTKGKSRIPPGIWNEVAALLQDRAHELPTLKAKVLEQLTPPRWPYSFRISGFLDEESRGDFGRRLRAFMNQNNWPANYADDKDFVRVDINGISQGQVDRITDWISSAIEGRRDVLGFRHGSNIRPDQTPAA
jgi:hypothetical protein